MKKVLYRNRYVLISTAAALVLLGVWELVARLIDIEIVLPTFTSVGAAFFGLFADPAFYRDIGLTMLRCLCGYAVGFVLGVSLGLIAGRKKSVAAALAPVVAVMRTTPVAAVTLVFALWMGENVLPSFVGILLVFPVIYQQIKTAAENIDRSVDDVLAEFGSGFLTNIRTVYLPLVLPYALSGVSATFGMNIKAVISAEVLAYTVHSIGYRIYFSKANFLNETPTLFAWVLVAILLSVLFEFLLKCVIGIGIRRISWLDVGKERA